jgi:pseudouridine synthase
MLFQGEFCPGILFTLHINLRHFPPGHVTARIVTNHQVGFGQNCIVNLRISGHHTWFELIIHEGRNRQVRRMCEALGHQVSRLVRIGYAFLTLDNLAPGQKRLLSEREVKRLQGLNKKG